ncbi:hypothetical protein ES708_24744 [subsurface metagenome]
MKISKAIEILNALTRYDYNPTNPDAPDALKLAREALECIEVTRRNTGCESFGKLPGEDPE